jgi:ATP-dependent helicase/nuclease subunit A
VLAHLSGRALHSDHEGVDDSIPLSFETMGPDVVGDAAHDTFALALRTEVDTETLRACGGPLPAAIDRAIAQHASGVAPDEREQLRRYLESSLLPAFAETALWERLHDADRRYIEEPLDGVVRVGEPGLAVEVGGQADIVSVDDAGEWHVDDLKVTLTPIDESTRRRYELQATAYAWALNRQPGVKSVTTTVTTIGAEQTSWTIDAGDAAFKRALDHLYDLHWE